MSGLLRIARTAVFAISVVLFSLLISSPAFAAGNWAFSNITESSPTTGSGFHMVAMSSDGRYMYSSSHYEGFYRSTDYGLTWTLGPSLTPQDYAGITTSSNGQYVYMSSFSGDIWFSSDFGDSWTKRTDVPQTGYRWVPIETSSNGQTTIVGTEDQGVLISDDYGLTFSPTSLPADEVYYGVSVSADGNFMLAAQYGGLVFTSIDGGANWVPTTLPSGGYFESSASSTGQYLAIVSPGGGIFISSDYGANWTVRPGTESPNWYDIDISDSGQYMAAVANSGDIYASSDYGQTWTNQTESSAYSNLNYSYVTISGDGKYILAPVPDDDLYLGYNLAASETLSGPLSDQSTQKQPINLLAATGDDVSLVTKILAVNAVVSAVILHKYMRYYKFFAK